MFKRFVAKIREVLAKMNLIKSIENISEHKDIYVNEKMYQKIDEWKALYKGYFEEIHQIKYHTIDGQKTRRMLTLNMPKVAAEEMASLIFNEKCEISISNEGLKEFIIDDVFRKNKFNRNFQIYLEYMMAYGGMVIKPFVKDDQIKLSFVTADCFIPIEYDNSGIRGGVFLNEFRKGKDKYTHLEWHVWDNGQYIIKNEVYKSQNGDDLGVKVALKSIYPELEEEVPIEHLDRPLFVYFKPNLANNIDTHSPLGVSLYANSLDVIKAIDTAFDSFEREFRLGKKRIIVPAHMVKTVVDPITGAQHRYFDANDETYEAFDYGNMDTDTIKDINIELRVDEHIAAINALLNLFAMQTGFSAGTFSFDGKSMKTATEVVSEQSKTFKSKKSHEIIIEAGLQELIDVIVKLAQLYNIHNTTEEYDVSVAFDDSIAEDKNTELTMIIQEVNNKLTPRKQAIMKYHGLTEQEAEKWMQMINEENATAIAASLDFFGGSGD